MKKLIMLISLIVMGTMLTNCTSVSVKGGHESVLEAKPLIFGHGGVYDEPVSSGQEYAALTTDAIDFDITPITYTEDFSDFMTGDRTPIKLSAYFKIQIKKGQSPNLYKNFGVEWYKHSLQTYFRQSVRDKGTSFPMFDLTSNRIIISSIDSFLLSKSQSYVKSLNMPVEVLQANIGNATPPQEVLEENKRTAAQNQSKLTQDARAIAELSRKQAEVNKAIADKAYKNEMGMTIEEYMKLRGLEIEKEKIEIVRDKQNVTIVMGTGLQPTVPVK